ncbi:hypothetical protein [Kitasatospora sp. NPDC002965]|uniref:type I-G CRISPR-associated protein, Cas3-extension family n=1 Tax=Kitasatospora sp. NPDC002965 TaxID=3154775 RepID=UPI0033A31D25
MTTDHPPITLPALDGTHPLGFLAALGTLAALDLYTPLDHTRLSFNSAGQAVLSGPGLTGVEDVVRYLAAVVDGIGAHQVIPGISGYPIPRQGTADDDPSRLTRVEAVALQRTLITEQGHQAAAWVDSILSIHCDNLKTPRGNPAGAEPVKRARLTPFIARAGQQTVHSFFAAPLDAVRADPTRLLTEALTGWKRYEGVTGEGLDHHAPVPAHLSPDGKPKNWGVPGATWLATLSIALTRLGARAGIQGPELTATLWHRTAASSTPVMVWPLWSPPLDRHAVDVMLSLPYIGLLDEPAADGSLQTPGTVLVHLDTEPHEQDYDDDRPHPLHLANYGITSVHAAARERGKHNDGPLRPVRLTVTDTPAPAAALLA